MRLSRRLADAARSPSRFAAFIGRVVAIVRAGDLPDVVQRLRGPRWSAAAYRRWLKAQPPPLASASLPPFLVAVDPVDGASRDGLRARARSMPREAQVVLLRGDDGRWAPIVGPDSTRRSLAEWMDETGVRWIWWVCRPVRLEPGAVDAIAEACRLEDARIVYTDHDVEDARGRPSRPCFKPAWDAEQVLEHDYVGPLIVTHRSLASAIDRAAGSPAAVWRVLVDVVTDLPPPAVVHVPRVLQHLPLEHDGAADLSARHAVASHVAALAARRGDMIDVAPERRPWLRYSRPVDASLSVVIPTRDHVPLLERCLRSIVEAGIPATEVVIVDNGSRDERLHAVLADVARTIPLRTVQMPIPFNFARLCNGGARAASGRIVMLLNNDATLADRESILELVGLASRQRIGAVGPLILYPDGRIQSAGVLVGVNRTATSALAGCPPQQPAAAAWCSARRRVSAVMGACLVVERSKYLAVGGMDEAFAVSHNEVDLCLRLEAHGWANVFTPFASVVHAEGATRGFEVTRTERERLAREEAAFVARWSAALHEVDPAYHPALARTGVPFSLHRGPVPAQPRRGWRTASLDAGLKSSQAVESTIFTSGTANAMPRGRPSEP